MTTVFVALAIVALILAGGTFALLTLVAIERRAHEACARGRGHRPPWS